ncbi:MAG: hypothetical protein DBY09_08460 [Selenomonadales bacterium]|nr:MAG: hypothetical protein DBY09_08460 [Selenomonadales bacterium]
MLSAFPSAALIKEYFRAPCSLFFGGRRGAGRAGGPARGRPEQQGESFAFPLLLRPLRPGLSREAGRPGHRAAPLFPTFGGARKYSFI